MAKKNSAILNEREEEVLRRRFGFGDHQTLQEVGLGLSVTRERVRQIQKKALAKLQHSAGLFDWIEKTHPDFWEPFASTVDHQIASDILKPTLDGSPLLNEGHLSAPTTLIAVRALVSEDAEKTISRWPRFSLAACGLAPSIRKHPSVIAREQEASRHWTYRDLAALVISEAGEPLHWQEIIRRAEAKGLREDIFPTSMFNAVMSADDLFARVGPGTYGLVEWGLEDVKFYPDIIREVLVNAEKPLTSGAIHQAVNRVRPIKKSSLVMYLDMDHRFYKSIQNTYGLREWLPEREKQTLRANPHLVEDRKSYQRLKRAQENGYRISYG